MVSLIGKLVVAWAGPDIPSAMDQIGQANIMLYDVSAIDEVTIQFSVLKSDFEKLIEISKKRGDRLQILSRKGISWYLPGLLKRPILIFGIILLFCLSCFLPGRVLFLSVEGNETLPDSLILDAARNYGVAFGCSGREIRSEALKNGMLEAVPQLQWAGINTYGCHGVITVRERSEKEVPPVRSSVCHLVATQDGVVTSCTVTAGSPACTVGQAVEAGDLLISGYTDCGITIKAERAVGEVFARTLRNLEAVTLSNRRYKSKSGDSNAKFSLVIGKKRINFYKGSGISGGSCDKMYSKYVLTLPGGFTLPVALVKETVSPAVWYDEPVNDTAQLLREYSAAYLKTQMVAGQVLDRFEIFSEAEGLSRMVSSYSCTESIGKVQEEMIGEFNGKIDRTDRER